MAPPTRTITASPSPQAVAVPATVPVGHGAVSPTDAVWAQESLLHVGRGRVDLTPRRVDAFVVVARRGLLPRPRRGLVHRPGAGARHRPARRDRALATNKDGSALRVEVTPTSGAAPTMHAYDARDGSAVPPESVVPATVDRPAGQVRDGQPAARAQRRLPAPAGRGEAGAGRFGVLGGDGQRLVAFDAGTRVRVPLSGVVGDGFELVRWTSGTTFHGLARSGTAPGGDPLRPRDPLLRDARQGPRR